MHPHDVETGKIAWPVLKAGTPSAAGRSVVVGLAASPAYAWKLDPWSRTDVALEVAWTALHLMDLNQTL